MEKIEVHANKSEARLERIKKIKSSMIPSKQHEKTYKVVIFSKDRALQLDAVLRSLMLHCIDIELSQVSVLYTASSTEHELRYTRLISEYAEKDSHVCFLQETDFHNELLSLIVDNEYVLFLVDDNIFIADFLVKDALAVLRNMPEIVGISLRLGENTTYCYMFDSMQQLPYFEPIGNDIYRFSWKTGKYDFGYPLEVSSSLYRTADILPILSNSTFGKPNSLEILMAGNAGSFTDTRPFLGCYKTSRTFCLPINKVQNEIKTNRSGVSSAYNSESLGLLFDRGERIDVDAYTGFIPDSCHQEITLHFVKGYYCSPKVTVVVPCYNQAQYLPDAVESIANQTYNNWECIIVNDGSTDNTTEVAKKLIQKYSTKNIKLIEKPNGGVSQARNVGISNAAGEWILALDSDDMIDRDYLLKAIQIINANPTINLVSCDMQEFGVRNGEWIPAEYNPQRILMYNTFIVASIFKKTLWEKIGGYYEGLPWQTEDWNFWIDLSKIDLHSVKMSEKLFYYRTTNKSAYDKLLPHFEDIKAIVKTLHPDLYGKDQTLQACFRLQNISIETYQRLLNVIEKHPNLSMPHLWKGLYFLNTNYIEAKQSIEKALSIAADCDPLPSIIINNIMKLNSIKLNSKIKILFYYAKLHNSDRSFAGTNEAVVSLAQGLSEICFDYLIHITGNHVIRGEQFGKVRMLPMPTPEESFQFLTNYDVVVFATHLQAFQNISKPCGQKWILHQHCWAVEPNELARINDFDQVIALSEIHQDAIIKQGISKTKVQIVPNGVDTNLFSTKQTQRKPYSIMFAGAVVPHKGVHILLQAFPLVRQVYPQAQLHIYGNATMWNMTNEYEHLLKKFLLKGCFFHGAIPNRKMPDIYSKHSILCLPSQLENFSLVTIEAQACGCIPVVNNTGGVPETLLDGETGFLYGPNTPATLCKAIIKAFKAIDTNPLIRSRAEEFIRTKLDISIIAKHYSMLIDQLQKSEVFTNKYKAEADIQNNSKPLQKNKCLKINSINILRKTPVLLCYPYSKDIWNPPIISENEIFCGPDSATVYGADGLKEIRTNSGTYDIFMLLYSIPKHKCFELVVVRPTINNLPVNTSTLNCIRVAIIGKDIYEPHQTNVLIEYLEIEKFDYILIDKSQVPVELFDTDAVQKPLSFFCIITGSSYPIINENNSDPPGFISVKQEALSVLSNIILLGERLYSAGKTIEAMKCFTHVLTNPGDNDSRCQAFNNIGVIAYGMKDMKRAEQMFISSLNIDPVNIEAVLNLSVIYLSQNRYDINYQLLKIALQAHPDNVQILEHYELCKKMLKNEEMALVFNNVMNSGTCNFQQFLNTLETLDNMLSCAIEELKKYPENHTAADQFHHMRSNMVRLVLTMPTEKLEQVWTKDLRKFIIRIRNSGICEAPRLIQEQENLRQYADSMRTCWGKETMFPFIFACMLMGEAFEVELPHDLESIPSWLHEDLISYVFADLKFFRAVGDSERYVDYITRWLEYLWQKMRTSKDCGFWKNIGQLIVTKTCFIPMYFCTKNIRTAYQLRGYIIEWTLRQLNYQLSYQFPRLKSKNKRKRRFGIICMDFFERTETFTTLPAFKYLDRSSYEVILYAYRETISATESIAKRASDRFILLPQNVAEAVALIRKDNLDALLIGTNVTAVQHPLSFVVAHRLARFQFTCFSSPVTTGLTNVDVYVSGELTELSSDPQQQYTEKLIRFPGTGFCFDYANSSKEIEASPTRSDLNIPVDAVVFISGANLSKISPELRETWARLLSTVQNSVLVLYPFTPSWRANYSAYAFLETMYDLMRHHNLNKWQLVLVNPLASRTQVMELLKIADVYLDSFPYSGSNSIIDPLEVGLVPVAMSGSALRSTQGAAILSEISMVQLVAKNAEDYLQIATNIATDSVFRKQLSEEITLKMNQTPRFLDSKRYSRQIQNMIEKYLSSQ